MARFITKNNKKIPMGKGSGVKVSEMNISDLSNKKLQSAIEDRKKLPKFLVEALLREKTKRSKHDICGVCGDELPDRGTCKRCDAKDAQRAKNWSTMTEDQRERFFINHGVENLHSIHEQAKLPYSKLTNHWKEELKRDGFGK